MDLEKALLQEHSKRQTHYIGNHIGNDQKKFDTLVSLMLTGPTPIPQRAAWVMSKCCEEHPSWSIKLLGNL